MKVIRLSKQEARKKLGDDYNDILFKSQMSFEINGSVEVFHRFYAIIQDGDYLKLCLDDMYLKVLESLGYDPYRISYKGEVLETEVIDEDIGFE